MDLTRDANEEFQERMQDFRSLASSIEGAGKDRLGVYKRAANWDDVRVLGNIIDAVEECLDRIDRA